MRELIVIGTLWIWGVYAYADENKEVDTSIVATMYTEMDDEDEHQEDDTQIITTLYTEMDDEDEDFLKHSLKC